MKRLLWETNVKFSKEKVKQKGDIIVSVIMRCRQSDNHSAMTLLKWVKVFNMVFGQTNTYMGRSSFMNNNRFTFMRYPDM